ncbi:MAG: acetyl-CoA carboxylase biotin carboxyl carrier protein [Opitutales bacterium]|nr:acetyl-CoA carboxylase biotin carboxyl carrier protein [Opitutales bacterium]
MKRSELTEFEIEEKDLKLRIKRRDDSAPVVYGPLPAAPVAPAPAAAAAAPSPATAAPEKDEGRYIKSPMVGTFYAAPSPESPPFVKTGDTVEPETLVCIIEAMKVMNEIKAETSGRLVEVLVKNGESVEYGQNLFKIT